MRFSKILYSILIKPLMLFFEILFSVTNRITHNPGLSIIFLSLAMNFLVLPLYRRADAVQEEERDIENKLSAGVAHIKKTFKGDERMMMLQTYYRQNNYRPTDVFKSSVSLFLEIPFFVAAYQFLSHLSILQGASLGVISDLGAADGLLNIAGHTVNLLPIVMTSVNLVSCVIFTKGYPLKTKIQLYGMAIFFLFFLYSSPSGLVFYWTLNNVFSLVKTVFYKLKNPGKVLRAMFAVIGAAILVFVIGFLDIEAVKYKVLAAAIGELCMIPFIYVELKTRLKWKTKPVELAGNTKIFVFGALFMTILVGALIPSAVISSSPQEFCVVNNTFNPLWYVCSALCLSLGTFTVWMGVFYFLTDKCKRGIFDILIIVLCIGSVINYLFFGNDLGILSNNLQYQTLMSFTAKEMLINIGMWMLVLVCVAVIYRYKKGIFRPVIAIACAAFAIMSVMNVSGISKSVALVGPDGDNDESPSFTLSKTGKNVVVIMMDRALNEYIPYFMNEKPELAKMFSGFTYYPNTISFGSCTNFAAPALYGGYEYTPVEMNARDTELLQSKHNEALRVMPVIFDEAGYDVTVCDPTYANYQQIPDLSIYDDHPDINTYITIGSFNDSSSVLDKIDNNMRNFFLYSFMKVLPLRVQTVIYQRGNYNNTVSRSYGTNISAASYDTQIISDNYTAEGIDSTFMDSYLALENFSQMTCVTKEDTNTFLMISNDLTHSVSLLQTPDYEPSLKVDNTEYELRTADKYTVDGVTLTMSDTYDYTSYQTNMAAMLKLGQWFEYLREIGVYDNTRIIVVADHAWPCYHLDSFVTILNDAYYDLSTYNPLLLVKDFNSSGFTTSQEFMTNADVPTLAFKNLIENPVNPSTGKVINNSEKYAHPQYVIVSTEYDPTENNGTQFFSADWISVSGDMRNADNWTFMCEQSTSPFANTQG